jgi:hypothetical protein
MPRRLQKVSVVQCVAGSLGRVLAPERWIFIIGCYNSGTTLLNEVLASHPDVAGLACEGVAVTDALPRPEEEGWTRMWNACYDSMRIDPSETGRARRAQRQWSLFYPPDATNLVEKSIANATRIPFLQAHFRPAYFIYLVRNGYAVAEGIRRKAEPGRWGNPTYQDRYPIKLCARQWRRTDEVVSDVRPEAERFLSLQYEDFTADPEREMSRITDFLGLAPLPNEVLSGTWNVHGYGEPIRNMNPRSYQRLSPRDAAIIEEEASAALGKYGYQRPKMAAHPETENV